MVLPLPGVFPSLPRGSSVVADEELRVLLVTIELSVVLVTTEFKVMYGKVCRLVVQCSNGESWVCR